MAKNRGDHAPFEEAGVPVAFFGSGESDDYHKPTDTLEKLRPALLVGRARGERRCGHRWKLQSSPVRANGLCLLGHPFLGPSTATAGTCPLG
jgi:hypothetical protein